ncbi:unnamed protein product [Camellia sinensis]
MPPPSLHLQFVYSNPFRNSPKTQVKMSDQDMGRLWTFITHVHALAGGGDGGDKMEVEVEVIEWWCGDGKRDGGGGTPVTMLLYPLYASVMAIESPSKVDDEQWLAYWILYSFLTLVEMLLQPILQWIPIWYDIKLAFVAWLVLPQFRGAAVIYERFVREKLRKYGAIDPHKSPNGNRKGKNKFVDFITPKKSTRLIEEERRRGLHTFFTKGLFGYPCF